MILFAVRHGVTEWNQIGRFQGQTDVPLNDDGREQARSVARRLAATRFERIYSSDLSRAHDTARAIADGREVELVTDAAFREMHLGELEGLSRGDVDARYGAFMSQWAAAPSRARAPGGETFEELQARVWAGFERIRAAHEQDRVLLVAHGFAIISLLCKLLDVPLDGFRRLWIDTTSISEIRTRGERIHVKRVNDCAHLE